MEFKIKYYKDLVSFHIPDQNVLGNILPNTAPAAVSEAEEVARALSVPFGKPPDCLKLSDPERRL